MNGYYTHMWAVEVTNIIDGYVFFSSVWRPLDSQNFTCILAFGAKGIHI